jgi:hypothetical protein
LAASAVSPRARTYLVKCVSVRLWCACFVRVLVWVRMCAGRDGTSWDGMEWNGTEEDMDARIGGDARRCAQP